MSQRTNLHLMPPLTISVRVEDSFAILDLSGGLTLSPSLSTLREVARNALQRNKIDGIILCVSQITATDSAGIGELTIVYTISMKRSCPIVLVGVSPSLGKMLELTRLDGILPSAGDIASAKRLMGSSRV